MMNKVINKSYKFRIYPNEEQKELLHKHFGCSRFVYNYFLNERKVQYDTLGKSDNYYIQTKKLTELKKDENYLWLKEINSQTLQSSLKYLEGAYTGFFSHRTGFPKFHKKTSLNTFEVPQYVEVIDKKLFLPKFKTGIRMKQHREMLGKICKATLIKTPTNKYYVSIVCEETIEVKEKPINEVGIDLGVKSLLTLSDGTTYENPKFLSKYKKELRIAQQYLSRKKKGSRGFENQKIKVARIQEKISNCRLDNLHKITKELTTKYSTICAEDLSVRDMITKKHYFNKAILDSSFGTFLSQLTYKGDWYNCRIIKINRYYPSSQTCFNCGYVNSNIKDLSIREWTCPHCGTIHNRDVNAAKNILAEGLRESASSGTGDYTDGVSDSAKQKKKQGSRKPISL
jgi:putative transposase